MSHRYSVGELVDVSPVTRVGRPNSAGGKSFPRRIAPHPGAVPRRNLGSRGPLDSHTVYG